jgi:hypothetical protein
VAYPDKAIDINAFWSIVDGAHAREEALDMPSSLLGEQIAALFMLRSRMDAEIARRVAVRDSGKPPAPEPDLTSTHRHIATGRS